MTHEPTERERHTDIQTQNTWAPNPHNAGFCRCSLVCFLYCGVRKYMIPIHLELTWHGFLLFYLYSTQVIRGVGYSPNCIPVTHYVTHVGRLFVSKLFQIIHKRTNTAHKYYTILVVTKLSRSFFLCLVLEQSEDHNWLHTASRLLTRNLMFGCHLRSYLW